MAVLQAQVCCIAALFLQQWRSSGPLRPVPRSSYVCRVDSGRCIGVQMRSATIRVDVCKSTHVFHPQRLPCLSCQSWFVVGFGLDGLGRRCVVGPARFTFFFRACFSTRDDSLTLNGSSGMDAVFGFVSSFMARLVPIQVRAGSPFFHHRFPFLWLGTEEAFHAQDIFLFRAFAVRVDVHVFVDVSTAPRACVGGGRSCTRFTHSSSHSFLHHRW